MGGKSESTTPPPAVEPAPGLDMGMMLQLFSSMMESNAAAQAPAPTIPDAPEVVADPEIDWEERQKKLKRDVRVDFDNEIADKRGRASTILTSPFLDEELQQTDSLLG